MRRTAVICLLLASFNTWSISMMASATLAGGQLAYYGQDFYQGKISKESLAQIMNQTHCSRSGQYDEIKQTGQGTCYRYSSVGYTGARKIMFGELFKQKDQRGTYVVDVYCGKKFYFNDVSQVSNMHTEVNIEHTWPQSRFNRSFDKETQKSDMHHLYPTDSQANSKRGNHPFGDIGNRPDELNVEQCDISKLASAENGIIFTPPVKHRGNVARSLFYFSTRYQLPISPSEEKIIRQWHKEDPVDQEEKTRHELISQHQNVRNPFVDFPELVEKIADF